MSREATSLEKFVMNILTRRGCILWPARQMCLNRNKREVFIGKRRRVFYTCECCGRQDLSAKDVEVDHIEPRIDPKNGFEGIENWINRTFVGSDKLQLLCKECHAEKSAGENQVRRSKREESSRISKGRGRNKPKAKTASRGRAKLARK